MKCEVHLLFSQTIISLFISLGNDWFESRLITCGSGFKFLEGATLAMLSGKGGCGANCM